VYEREQGCDLSCVLDGGDAALSDLRTPSDIGLDSVDDTTVPALDFDRSDVDSIDVEFLDLNPAELDRSDLAVLDPGVPLEITFIDVGQGDAILLELPTGEVILIDGGDDHRGEEEILPTLAQRDITRLDLLLLSHPHADHVGGLDEVIDTLDVIEVWENGEVNNTNAYNEFVNARDEEDTLFLVPEQGFIRNYGEVSLEVFNSGGEYLVHNNNSLVVMLRYGATSFLLTGDIETEEQYDLYEDYGEQLSAQLLKVPHHGSHFHSPNFVEAVAPEMAVISVGEGNRYGHPHERLLQAYREIGARICRTDRAGDILARSDGVRFEYECAAEEP